MPGKYRNDDRDRSANRDNRDQHDRSANRHSRDHRDSGDYRERSTNRHSRDYRERSTNRDERSGHQHYRSRHHRDSRDDYYSRDDYNRSDHRDRRDYKNDNNHFSSNNNNNYNRDYSNNNNDTRVPKRVKNEAKNVKITDLLTVRDYSNPINLKDNTLYIGGNPIRDKNQKREKSTTINHWSTGGFKVEEISPNNSKNILYTHGFPQVFIAKPHDSYTIPDAYREFLMPTKITSKEQDNSGYPRTDSEIAFSQHLTNTKNPARMSMEQLDNALNDIDRNGILQQANIDPQSKLRIKLYIQNSGLAPCTSERPGMKCNDYLPAFLDNLKSKLQIQYPSAEVRLKVSDPNGMSRYGDYNGKAQYTKYNSYSNSKDNNDIRKIYNQ